VVVRLLVLLLALAVVPAVGDMVETAVHAVEYGDLGHAASDPHEDASGDGDEHGCTPMAHLCACHASSPVAPIALALTVAPPAEARPRVLAWSSPGVQDRGPAAPPTRPPIA